METKKNPFEDPQFRGKEISTNSRYTLISLSEGEEFVGYFTKIVSGELSGVHFTSSEGEECLLPAHYGIIKAVESHGGGWYKIKLLKKHSIQKGKKEKTFYEYKIFFGGE